MSTGVVGNGEDRKAAAERPHPVSVVAALLASSEGKRLGGLLVPMYRFGGVHVRCQCPVFVFDDLLRIALEELQVDVLSTVRVDEAVVVSSQHPWLAVLQGRARVFFSVKRASEKKCENRALPSRRARVISLPK